MAQVSSPTSRGMTCERRLVAEGPRPGRIICVRERVAVVSRSSPKSTRRISQKLSVLRLPP